MVQLPRAHLGVTSQKMGEKGRIRQVPEATGIVGHDIGFARNVVMGGNIAKVALVKGIHTEQVGAGRDGGSRAFMGPGQCGSVVGGHPDGALGKGCVTG